VNGTPLVVDPELPVAVPYDPLSYLRGNALARGGAVAVYDDGVELDFGRLLRVVVALMGDLSARGVATGEVVAVALPNVWRYVALEIAIPAAGAVLLPLPMSLGRREVAAALDGSGAVMLITDDSELGRAIAATVRTVPTVRAVLDAEELDTEARAGDLPGHRPDPDRVVQIALTSGTTGTPKLASLTARLKQLTFEGFTGRLGLGPADRMLPLSPITQGAGEMCLFALRVGATLVMSHEARFDAERALALAERSRTTVLGGVPTMISRMLHAPTLSRTDLSAVRATISAGAALPPAVAQAWEELTGSRSCSYYGAMDAGQLAVPSPDDPPEKRWMTVGRPHDRAEVLICDGDGAPVPPGAEGEICMRGALVQHRYWGHQHGPYAEDGWAHLGDLGFVDDEGFLHVTGRLKDTIIRGGTNINPFEVEEVLRGLRAVRDVCVVGRPDSDLGERAAAFVVAAPGAALTLADIAAHLEQEGLARYKCPESLHLVDALPVGTTGKIDRHALRERPEREHGG
jgi:acyl-CoA synthetase (AMP-forming)/AMP-acid ligase II